MQQIDDIKTEDVISEGTIDTAITIAETAAEEAINFVFGLVQILKGILEKLSMGKIEKQADAAGNMIDDYALHHKGEQLVMTYTYSEMQLSDPSTMTGVATFAGALTLGTIQNPREINMLLSGDPANDTAKWFRVVCAGGRC